MKKRNLIVFLASLGLLFAACNNGGGSSSGGTDPGPVEDLKYTISFDANGGTSSKASEEVVAGSEYTLPNNPFTAPAGKEFAGWKVNGQGDLLQPGAKITVNANVRLVAQWKDAAPAEVKFTISFDANGGTGTKTAEEALEGSEYTLPQNPFTAPSGKEFAGWKVNGEGNLLQPGAKITVNGDVSLVAQWKELPKPIDHQDPFIRTIENPSTLRAFKDGFDTMIEDFSGATPSGTTTGLFNDSFLRVLVDSNDTNEPTSPDAAIYKMATGVTDIDKFDGIGFKVRMLGNGALNLSNLVLGLRGGDDFKVFELNLADAVNPDGEPLEALTGEFAELVVSPNLSIEDADTVYQLLDGTDSEVKVLDEILGFHLYALDEECSAVLEIEEVFVTLAGEKTTLDSFDRAAVNKTDPSCWWRDSTGFIVQKGVTLSKDKHYLTDNVTLAEYENLVINVLGDTSELTINDVAFSSLKDNENKSVSNAVNGAFNPLVINLANSNLELKDGKFEFESGKEVTISQVFLTNLIDELPVEDYPLIDFAGGSYVSDFAFTMAKGTVKTNYDEAILDTRATDAGLNYVISYLGSENIEIDGKDLVISGGDYDYTNLVIGSNAVPSDYLVIAVKEGANLNNFRIKLGKSSTIYANDWFADSGLKSIPANIATYPYVKDGYELLVIDLAKSGFENIDNEIQMWYTGTEDLTIGSIFFADKYAPDYIVNETEVINVNVAAGEGYGYVAGADLSAGTRYIHIETDAAVGNEIRFEGVNGAKWLKNDEVIDINGNPVIDGSTDYIIDLEASGLTDGSAHKFHIHSTLGEAFSMKASIYERSLPFNVEETPLGNFEVAASSDDYKYVAGVTIPADDSYLHIVTTAGAANLLRFEGIDGAKWLNQGHLIDPDGNVIPDGSTDFVIDLVASELKGDAEQVIHIHSCPGEGFTLTASTVKYSPLTQIVIGDTLLDMNVTGDAGYKYVAGPNLPQGTRYLKVETNAAVGNELRFEGINGAKWLKNDEVIDNEGNPVADGSTEYIIDLVASGLTDGSAHKFHIHSTLGDAFQIRITIVNVYEVGSYAYLLAGYIG